MIAFTDLTVFALGLATNVGHIRPATAAMLRIITSVDGSCALRLLERAATLPNMRSTTPRHGAWDAHAEFRCLNACVATASREATHLAMRQSIRWVDSAHILAGLWRESSSAASCILRDWGLREESFTEAARSAEVHRVVLLNGPGGVFRCEQCRWLPGTRHVRASELVDD